MKLYCTILAMLFAGNALAGDVTFKISNMHCGGCANKVKAILTKTEAVSNVDVNLDTKLVKVTFDDSKTTAKKLQNALKDNKYEAEVSNETFTPRTAANKPAAAAEEANLPVYDSNATFKVANMRCGGCARRVKNTLNTTEAVGKIDIDLQTKIVKVNYNEKKTSPTAMIEALKGAKFEVEQVKE